MIEWQDRSTHGAERYVCSLATIVVDLARWTAREPWHVVVRYADDLRSTHSGTALDGLCCADDAKARALACAKPIADAIAERAAAVARALAVAVAGARLDGVE